MPEDEIDGALEVSCIFGDTSETELSLVEAPKLEEVRTQLVKNASS